MWQIQSQPTPVIYQGEITPMPPPVPPLADLLVWYKADTLTEAPDDAINNWIDSSGGGNGLVSAAFADSPQRSQNVYNGYRGATLSNNNLGVQGAFQSSSPIWIGSQSRSFYVVYSIADIEGFGTFDCGLGQFYTGAIAGQVDGTNTGDSFEIMERPDVACPSGCPYFTAWADDLAFGSGQTFNVPRLVTVTYDGTNVRCYLNGGAATTAAKSLNTASALLYVGILPGGGSPFFGDVLEILCYNVKHDDTTRTAIEAYLIAKYGI